MAHFSSSAKGRSAKLVLSLTVLVLLHLGLLPKAAVPATSLVSAPVPWSKAAPAAASNDGCFKDTGTAQLAAAARAKEIVERTGVASALFEGTEFGGLSLIRGAVSPEIVQQMRQDADTWKEEGRLTRSGQGMQNDEEPLDPQWVKYFGSVPTLRILEHDEAARDGSFAGMAYGSALMCALCSELSRVRPPSSEALEPGTLQIACYDGPGARYALHTDGCLESDLDDAEMEIAEQHRTAAKRRVTAILYLQEGWEEEWGGFFRAHSDADPSENSAYVDVSPHGGDLLLFRSRDLPHEVLTTDHKRFALSMWCHAAEPAEPQRITD